VSHQIPGRLFACALALYVWASSLYSTDSLIYGLTAEGGWPAALCMLILAVLAVSAAVDTIINDVLPHRIMWRAGRVYRQGLWMGMAVTYAGMAWVAFGPHLDGGAWLASYYLLCAAHCVSVAYVDLWRQHASRMMTRRHGDTARARGRRRDTDPGGADAQRSV
jgi:uncharacterized membrane protein